MYDVDVVVDAFDVDDVDDIGSFVCRFSVLFLTLKWEKESDASIITICGFVNALRLREVFHFEAEVNSGPLHHF